VKIKDIGKLRIILLFFVTTVVTTVVGAVFLIEIDFEDSYSMIKQEFLVLITAIIPQELDRNPEDVMVFHEHVKLINRDSNGIVKDFHLVGYH